MATEIEAHGPLFEEARARAYAEHMMRTLVDEVSAAASERVHFYLNTQIKHPTPYYETQINTRRETRGPVTYTNSVNDRGVVYGPWLEGTSHRNESTRFKGYASFRKATTDTMRQVGAVAGRVASDYVRDMNGR